MAIPCRGFESRVGRCGCERRVCLQRWQACPAGTCAHGRRWPVALKRTAPVKQISMSDVVNGIRVGPQNVTNEASQRGVVPPGSRCPPLQPAARWLSPPQPAAGWLFRAPLTNLRRRLCPASLVLAGGATASVGARLCQPPGSPQTLPPPVPRAPLAPPPPAPLPAAAAAAAAAPCSWEGPRALPPPAARRATAFCRAVQPLQRVPRCRPAFPRPPPPPLPPKQGMVNEKWRGLLTD